MGLVAGTGAPCERARGRTIDESGPGVRGEQPRVTTGNTMAPCVVIGEKAAGFLNEKHAL